MGKLAFKLVVLEKERSYPGNAIGDLFEAPSTKLASPTAACRAIAVPETSQRNQRYDSLTLSKANAKNQKTE